LFGSECLLDLGQVIDFVLVGNADVRAESQPQREFGELNFFQPIRDCQQNLLGALIVVVDIPYVVHSDNIALTIEIAGNEGTEEDPQLRRGEDSRRILEDAVECFGAVLFETPATGLLFSCCFRLASASRSMGTTRLG
jgi:hypothetical protein